MSDWCTLFFLVKSCLILIFSQWTHMKSQSLLQLDPNFSGLSTYIFYLYIYIWYYAYIYVAYYYIEYIYWYYIHQRYKSHVWSTLKPRAATRVTMTATYRNGWVATFLAAGISSLVKLLQTMRALNVGWWWTGDMANSDSPYIYMYRYMIINK